MLRAVARLSAALTGAAVAVAALAVPASADGYVPDGCVGSVVYACTGAATPDEHPRRVARVPVTLTTPGQQVFPGTTVGGQHIGSVVIPVPRVGTPGLSWTIGGEVVGPQNTGIVTPVQVCAFVTCVAAGTPVVIPGVTGPVVPVSIQSTTLTPAQTVTVPLDVTVPTQSAPAVATPPVQEDVVTLIVHLEWDELWPAAENTCRSGGGYPTGGHDPVWGEYRWTCGGGVLDVPSDVLFLVYYTWPE